MLKIKIMLRQSNDENLVVYEKPEHYQKQFDQKSQSHFIAIPVVINKINWHREMFIRAIVKKLAIFNLVVKKRQRRAQKRHQLRKKRQRTKQMTNVKSIKNVQNCVSCYDQSLK